MVYGSLSVSGNALMKFVELFDGGKIAAFVEYSRWSLKLIFIGKFAAIPVWYSNWSIFLWDFQTSLCCSSVMCGAFAGNWNLFSFTIPLRVLLLPSIIYFWKLVTIIKLFPVGNWECICFRLDFYDLYTI